MCAHEQVRRYLESVWTAVATVRVNVSELVFWKEVRLGLSPFNLWL